MRGYRFGKYKENIEKSLFCSGIDGSAGDTGCIDRIL